MKDKVKYMEYMTLLGEIYSKEITDVIKNAYWKVLQLYDDQECKRVFDTIITNNKFFPKPADFIELLRGDSRDRSILAWEKVYKSITGIGSYESVKFDDPVIHSCIELMGGWVQVCNMDNNDIKWKQKEFIEIYITMSKKNPEQHPKYLPGSFEINNSAKGFDIPNVIMIGNKEEQKKLAQHDELKTLRGE